MKPPVLIISKLASLRDLERACFCLNKEKPLLRLQSKHVVVAYVHGEAAQCLWDKDAAGRPLSVKQLTLVAVEVRVQGAAPIFPWHRAIRLGR